MPIYGVADGNDHDPAHMLDNETGDAGLADLASFLVRSTPATESFAHPDSVADGQMGVDGDDADVNPEDLARLIGGVQEELVTTGKVEQLVITDDVAVNATQRAMVESVVRQCLPSHFPVIRYSQAGRDRATAAVVDYICGYGPLQGLLNDPSVDEVIVRGCQPVMVERGGVLEDTEIRFINHDQLLTIMRRIAREVGRELNEAEPILNAWLKDGSRVNCIISPLAKEQEVLTIRKFSTRHFTLDDLVDKGSLPMQAAEWLAAAVAAKVNLVVSGGTGSGKTAMVRALAYKVPANEYLITIEDTWELRLANSRERVTTLVKREENSGGGGGGVSLRDLVINALRMRPDRIIVGEVRGPECFDMLQAFSTGHDGGLTTVHANDVGTAVKMRIPSLAKMADGVDMDTAHEQTVFAVELVVQVARTPSGKRVVREISTIDPDPSDWSKPAIQPVWLRMGGGELVQVGEPGPRVAAKLAGEI